MKYKSVERIEELGYEITIKRSGDGWIDIKLCNQGEEAVAVKCRTNAETMEKIRARISGEIGIKPDTYLSGALDHLYVNALLHTIKNDLPLADVAKDMAYTLNENDSRFLADKLNEKPAAVVAPEPELFYWIKAQKGTVQFSNEYVGTENGLQQYLKSYQGEVKGIESFPVEFRDDHREIERIIRCFKSDSGDKSQIRESISTFDDTAKKRLMVRLKENEINVSDFQDRYKNDDIKKKPKPTM
ncbi:TPA: hypothetical protein ACNV18_000836 [Pseudomonas putida]